MIRNPFLTLLIASVSTVASLSVLRAEPPQPFGPDWAKLDDLATGEWWTRAIAPEDGKPDSGRLKAVNVARSEVIAFGLYTHDAGQLKLTAQLYPLKNDEPRTVRLELQMEGEWSEVARQNVVYPGWTAHFRIRDWDSSKDVPYRLRHGDEAMFEGLIRKDPVDKNEIVIASMSCNSTRTQGPRPNIIENLQFIDPDVLFFAGDQTYDHNQHTAGWIQFGIQFRDVLRDRPVISIPDDHDVGHPNLWGEGGKKSETRIGHDGGYTRPADYVKMVERQQTWHLPDAWDPTPIQQGIGVYYTRLRIGGVDFAILEDRKFKSGPMGKIPQMGPRPDHINDPAYDRSSVDVPGLKLLGDRQLTFLDEWGQDWTGAEMKAVLSQTAFCGAVHLHGQPDNPLLADLDCNGWPQTGRNKALSAIRRAWAPHLCGDQHLTVVVQHGIDAHRDGPFGFTNPAIVNTIYGRWWHPEDEQPGPNPVPDSPLPWTGDYEDGLGNKITMLAYANPEDRTDELKRADGFGVARFRKNDRSIVFEAWHRFADIEAGDPQMTGWPVNLEMEDNDGREIAGWLPTLEFDAANPVVQVANEATGEILYTVRINGRQFHPKVYAPSSYTIAYGADRPEIERTGIAAAAEKGSSTLDLSLSGDR